jgi:predicted amidohydrolase YtcJ
MVRHSLLLFSLLALAATAHAAPAPERIYVDARVWTVDPAQPEADAFAVRGGRFVAVGRTAQLLKLKGPRTELVSLGGRRVLPGFIDAHWHIPAQRAVRVDALGSPQAIVERLQTYAAEHPGDDLLVGRGWMPADFPDRTAHRRYLDGAFPSRPVLVRDRDGHQVLANGAALAMFGITRESVDPPDGRIVRDADGEPSGVLQEGAASLIMEKLPKPSIDTAYDALREDLHNAARAGITSVHEASGGGLMPHELGAVRRALKLGEMRVRMRAALPFDPKFNARHLMDLRAHRDSARGHLFTYGAAKGMVDGTIDARTGFMLKSYVGGGNGLAFLSQDELNGAVARYDKAGLQVQLHAVGDGGVRMALDAFEHALRVNGPRDRRHRVEHGEVIDPADTPRFKKLGVVASMQAIFATPDENALNNYAPLLGERAANAMAFAALDASGAVQAFGSDYPVYPMDPLIGIHTAVTRTTRQREPAGGWYPAQRIDVKAAIRHYTLDAAYANFDERRLGSITRGKLADFVVLSRDILTEDPLQTDVLLTVMNGRETWRAAEFK